MPDYFSMLTQAILGTSSYLDSSNSPSTEPFIPTNNTHGFLTTTGFTNPTWSYSYGGNAICVSGTISISAVATNAKILWDGPKNNFELTEWLTDFMRLDSTLFGRMFGGEQTISDTFDIFGKLCAPATTDMSNTTSGSEVPDTIQILTHGGALDSTYWDFYPNHSYIDFAASRGHYTFSYDRLGSGRSQHPNPIQVVQIPLQVEILHDLVSQLRAGSFSDVQFKRVVGVGHSLGAALTQRVAGKYGEDFDAVVVMGHSGFHGGSAVGFAGLAQQIANTIPGEKGEEGRFKGLPNGYFTSPPLAQCAQWAFFYYPYFEESVFDRLLRSYGTNALGETLTLFPTYTPIPSYTRPVLVINGRQDSFYCQWDCLAQGRNIAQETLEGFFPNAKQVKEEGEGKGGSKALVVENIGHNINMHIGAREVFGEMVGWIEGLVFAGEDRDEEIELRARIG